MAMNGNRRINGVDDKEPSYGKDPKVLRTNS